MSQFSYSSDVQLITPLAKLQGKDAYLEPVKNFIAFFNALTIRTVFGEGDQVLVVYDMNFRHRASKD